MPQRPQPEPVDIGLGLKIFPSKTVAEARADLDEQELAKQDREITRMKLADYVADRQAKAAAVKQQQEQDAYLRDAVGRHMVDGKPDFDAVVTEAYTKYPDLAMSLEKQLGEHRSKLVTARKQELETDELQMKNDVSTMGRMVDPQAFAVLRPHLSPDAQQLVGEQFDPARIAQLAQAGAKNAATTQDMRIALQDGRIRDHFLLALENAATPEDVADINEGLDSMYGPKQAGIFRMGYGDPLTPEGKTKIQALRAATPKAEGKANLQKANFRLNGKDVWGSFDPETGHYSYDGKDVTEQVRDIPAASGATGGADQIPQLSIDPTSQNILSQTGLSINAFRLLTGQGSQLPRDQATRNRAAAEAQKWAREHNVDIATLPAQYKSNNDVLSANIARMNNTKIMESELQGTIENLRGVVKDADLGRLKAANVVKIWAGQEVNDSLAQQYALHLGQLRNELSAYYAATQGRTGNNITLQDQRDAELVLKNGLAAGSLTGLKKAIENSTEKMGTVMQGSVDRTRKAVWDLFGVGGNFSGTKPAEKKPTAAELIKKYGGG